MVDTHQPPLGTVQGEKPAILYKTNPAFKLVNASSSGSWVQAIFAKQTAAHLFRLRL
jgi:hypothetical protein